MCSGCRTPISTKDKKSNKYEEGVSCPKCYDISPFHKNLDLECAKTKLILLKKLDQSIYFKRNI